MFSVNSESAVYAWRNPDDQEISGVTGTYVYDSLNARDNNFMKHKEITLCKLESKPLVSDNFDFYGLQIMTISPKCFTDPQPYYTSNLKQTPINTSFETFQRDRVLFTWLTNYRPDICCIANRAAQVSKSTFNSSKIRELNKHIRLAKNSIRSLLSLKRLQQHQIHSRLYSGDSFPTNDDLAAQLGYIIFLADKTDRRHIMKYSSKKRKRVV